MSMTITKENKLTHFQLQRAEGGFISRLSVAAPEQAGDAEQELRRLTELINLRIRPEKPIRSEEVYLASCRVASDQVNSFGGRFPREEHDLLAALLIDSPVLIGHRKDQLPIGRAFHAELEDVEGTSWVTSYFYWMRDSEGGARLKAAIDGKIVRECSLGFLFGFAECSVCGKDIRSCQHRPLAMERDNDGGEVRCHFNYRQLKQVLETSLVYRGAVAGTKIRRLAGIATEDAPALEQVRQVQTAEELPEGLLVAATFYDGIPVMAELDGGALTLRETDGSELFALPAAFEQSQPGRVISVPGRVVGYHGKSRLPASLTREYLSAPAADGDHLVLFLYPSEHWHELLTIQTSSLRIKAIPTRATDRHHVAKVQAEIGTRDGLLLWAAGDQSVYPNSFHLPHQSEPQSTVQPVAGWYRLSSIGGEELIRVEEQSGRTAGMRFILPRGKRPFHRIGLIGSVIPPARLSKLLTRCTPLRQAAGEIRPVSRQGGLSAMLIVQGGEG